MYFLQNEREAKETFARNIRVQPNNRRRIVNESHRTGGPNNFSIHQGHAANNRLHQDTDDDASSSEDEAIMSQQRFIKRKLNTFYHATFLLSDWNLMRKSSRPLKNGV